MKPFFLILLFSISGFNAASSLSFETDQQAKTNVQKLELLFGQCKGQGWRLSITSNDTSGEFPVLSSE